MGLVGLNAVFNPQNVWDKQFDTSFFRTHISAAEAIEVVALLRKLGCYPELLVMALFACARHDEGAFGGCRLGRRLR